MTARLHNGPSQTNVIISDYVSLCVKYDGNPDRRRTFRRKFQPRRTLLELLTLARSGPAQDGRRAGGKEAFNIGETLGPPPPHFLLGYLVLGVVG